MPFVTEEIYSMLPIKDSESIMISSYPKTNKKLLFTEAEKIIDDEVEFIKSFRNTKAENNITKDFKVMFDTDNDIELVVKMLKLGEHLITQPLDIKAYKVSSNQIKATIFFENIESEADIEAKNAQIELLKASIERREKLLANENYVNKAPEKIVMLDREKLALEKKKLELLIK